MKKLLSIVALAAVAFVCQAQTARKLTVNITPDGESNVQVFLPQNPNGKTVVGCPGGGYSHLSMQNEGTDWADFFNSQGITYCVLKYRMPKGDRTIPMSDAQNAIRMVRDSAQAWNVSPYAVGIMGFSAGAHLSAHYSNRYDCPEVREVFPDSKKVQATVLCYPVITGDPAFRHNGSIEKLSGHYPATAEDAEKYSCEKMVAENTPPAFIWATAADPIVPVNNSLLYAQALSAHNVPLELHIYPFGKHGLATSDLWTNTEIPPEVACTADWIPNLKKWLAVNL